MSDIATSPIGSPEAASSAPVSAPASIPAPVSAPQSIASAPTPVSPPPAGGTSSIPGLSSEPPQIQSLVTSQLAKLGVTQPNLGIAPQAAPQSVPQPAAPQIPSVVDFLAQRGVQVQDPSLAGQAFDDLVARARQAEAYEQQLAQLRAAQVQQSQAQPQAQPAPQEDYWAKAWNVPQLSPQTQQYLDAGMIVKDDQSGRFVVAPEHRAYLPPTIAEEVNRFAQAKQELTKQFGQNPVKFTWEKIQPELDRYVQEKLNQHIAQRENFQQFASFVDSFEQQHKGWMFVNGGATRDAQGQAIPTAEGQFFLQEATRLRSFGVPPQEAMNLAMDRLQLQMSRHAPPPAPQPVAPAPAPVAQQSFLENAAKLPQALHNPSVVPSPQVTSQLPKAMTWQDMGPAIRNLAKTLPAA